MWPDTVQENSGQWKRPYCTLINKSVRDPFTIPLLVFQLQLHSWRWGKKRRRVKTERRKENRDRETVSRVERSRMREMRGERMGKGR